MIPTPPGVALVTGSSRGLGLEFVVQLLRLGCVVIATCRNPTGAPALQALRQSAEGHNLAIYELDQASEPSVKKAAAEIATKFSAIDYLICNAGISSINHPIDPPLQCPRSDMMRVFETNVAGTLTVIQEFLPLVRASKQKKVLAVSSLLGSVENCNIGGYTSYRASKAALNMVIKTLATDPQTKDEATFLSVHPGWVQTDMGNSGERTAPYTPQQSIEGMLHKVLFPTTQKDSGRFLSLTGDEVAW